MVTTPKSRPLHYLGRCPPAGGCDGGAHTATLISDTRDIPRDQRFNSVWTRSDSMLQPFGGGDFVAGHGRLCYRNLVRAGWCSFRMQWLAYALTARRYDRDRRRWQCHHILQSRDATEAMHGLAGAYLNGMAGRCIFKWHGWHVPSTLGGATGIAGAVSAITSCSQEMLQKLCMNRQAHIQMGWLAAPSPRMAGRFDC